MTKSQNENVLQLHLVKVTIIVDTNRNFSLGLGKENHCPNKLRQTSKISNPPQKIELGQLVHSVIAI